MTALAFYVCEGCGREVPIAEATEEDILECTDCGSEEIELREFTIEDRLDQLNEAMTNLEETAAMIVARKPELTEAVMKQVREAKRSAEAILGASLESGESRSR